MSSGWTDSLIKADTKPKKVICGWALLLLTGPTGQEQIYSKLRTDRLIKSLSKQLKRFCFRLMYWDCKRKLVEMSID